MIIVEFLFDYRHTHARPVKRTVVMVGKCCTSPGLEQNDYDDDDDEPAVKGHFS